MDGWSMFPAVFLRIDYRELDFPLKKGGRLSKYLFAQLMKSECVNYDRFGMFV